MTGAFMRVERDGKWFNIEVEYLTDEERNSLLANDDRLIHWLHLTCNTIVKCEKIIINS